MTRRVLVLCLVAALVRSPGVDAQGVATTDAELAKGIEQTQAGDFDAAVMTLDAAARRLAAEGGRARELSRAYAYLAIAYLGLNHEQTARAKFLEAWRADRSLTMGTDEFPPSVVKMFDEIRRRALAEQAMAPAPAPTPAPMPRATPAPGPSPQKKQGGRVALLVLGVAAVGGGVALAAGSGGSSGDGPSNTTPATTTPANPTVTVAFNGSSPAPGSTIRWNSGERTAQDLLLRFNVTSNVDAASVSMLAFASSSSLNVACLTTVATPSFSVTAGRAQAVEVQMRNLTDGLGPNCSAPFTTDRVTGTVSGVGASVPFNFPVAYQWTR